MKKILIIIGVSTAIFASCKKDYSCECTRTDKTKTYPTLTNIETMNGKKKDVIAQCDKGDTTYNDGDLVIECEAK